MFRTPDQKLVFLHIPKTGGSSIAKAIGKHYRRSRFHVKAAPSWAAASRAHHPDGAMFEDYLQALRSSLLLYSAELGTRYLTGHVWYTDGIRALRKDGYAVVTCLRDPVDRFISNYLYDRFKSVFHKKTDLDIEEYLESEEARRQAGIYLRYLNGIRDDGDHDSDQALSAARESLGQVDILGFLDDLGAFSARLESLLGRSLRIRHERSSPASARQAKELKSSTELRRQIADLCARDIELYSWARSRFG